MIDKNKIPKDLFGEESEVITRLSREFNLTREDAKVALDRFVHIGIVLEERSLSYSGMPSVPVYSYNKNFDWDAYEDSHYLKYRYMVVGKFNDLKSDNIPEFNVIVEWNKRDLTELYNEIENALESPSIEAGHIFISNLIEIGYPTEKD